MGRNSNSNAATGNPVLTKGSGGVTTLQQLLLQVGGPTTKAGGCGQNGTGDAITVNGQQQQASGASAGFTNLVTPKEDGGRSHVAGKVMILFIHYLSREK